MLDIKIIRENPELIKQNCKNRLSKADIDALLATDKELRAVKTRLEELRAKRNAGSKTKPTPEMIAEIREIGEEIKKLETDLEPLEAEFKKLWMAVPNMTHPDVVVSDDEDANPVLEIHGEPTKFDFEPLDHVQLAEKSDLIDFDRATKVSGAKFYYLKNGVALLEFALIQYALDVAMRHGFIPFSTPDLAKREVLE
jgi:seryl-tRNA synthetase